MRIIAEKMSDNLQKFREIDLQFQPYEKFVRNLSEFCVKIEDYWKLSAILTGWNLKLQGLR